MKEPLKAGDVLLTSEAPTGEVAFLAEDKDWCLGQRIFGLRGKPDLLDGRYLFYSLRGGEIRHQLMSRTTGTTVSGIRQSELVKIELDLPPIAEQERIAATLGALDDKILSDGSTIALTHQLLDAMSALIADHLPRIPLRMLTSAARSTVNPTALGDRYVDYFSLPSFDVCARPERVRAESIMSNKILLDRPTILLSRLNPRTDRTWWAEPEAGTPALASTEFACLQAGSRQELAALWLSVRDTDFRAELGRRVTGTSGSHQRVRPDDLLAIEVPDVRLLSRRDKDEALQLLELIHQRWDEIDALEELRRVLLPELLSGRIRVAKLQEAFP